MFNYRKIYFHVFCVLVFLLFFLLQPAPTPESICGAYFQFLHDKLGFYVNCDTGGFTTPLKDPSLLFEPGFIRQNRPGYILGGYLLSIIPSLIIRFFHNGDLVFYSVPLEDYLGFILFNFLTLVLCSYLYCTLLISKFYIPVKIVIASLPFLLGNNILKVFSYSPHTQIFNILYPLLCIKAFYVFLDAKLSYKRIISFSLLCSFCLLIYPSFLIVYISGISGMLYKSCMNVLHTKNIHNPTFQPLSSIISLTEIIKPIFLSISILFFPYFLYTSLVTHIAGYYYSPEISLYRQVVWIYDAYINQTLTNTLLSKFLTFKDAMPFELLASLLLNLLIALIFRFAKFSPKLFPRTKNLEVTFSFALIICLSIYTYAIGFYVERLYYPIFIVSICLNLIHLKNILYLVRKSFSFQFMTNLSNVFATIVSCLSIVYFIKNTLSCGPFS